MINILCIQIQNSDSEKFIYPHGAIQERVCEWLVTAQVGKGVREINSKK